MTTTKTNQELMLELAGRLKAPDGTYPLRRPSEGRPSWVPVALHLETLMAALARCGVRFTAAHDGDRGAVYTYAGAVGSEIVSSTYHFGPADPDSILNAALKAALEVVPSSA